MASVLYRMVVNLLFVGFSAFASLFYLMVGNRHVNCFYLMVVKLLFDGCSVFASCLLFDGLFLQPCETQSNTQQKLKRISTNRINEMCNKPNICKINMEPLQ